MVVGLKRCESLWGCMFVGLVCVSYVTVTIITILWCFLAFFLSLSVANFITFFDFLQLTLSQTASQAIKQLKRPTA